MVKIPALKLKTIHEKILLQPSIQTYNMYSEFAKQNWLQFKIVDFTYPKILNSDLRYLRLNLFQGLKGCNILARGEAPGINKLNYKP